MTEPLLTFSGAVHCRRSAEPLGLTLSGTAAGTPAEETLLAFSARAPGELPHELADVAVERLGLTHYRIASGTREWMIEAAALRGEAQELGEPSPRISCSGSARRRAPISEA